MGTPVSLLRERVIQTLKHEEDLARLRGMRKTFQEQEGRAE